MKSLSRLMLIHFQELYIQILLALCKTKVSEVYLWCIQSLPFVLLWKPSYPYSQPPPPYATSDRLPLNPAMNTCMLISVLSKNICIFKSKLQQWYECLYLYQMYFKQRKAGFFCFCLALFFRRKKRGKEDGGTFQRFEKLLGRVIIFPSFPRKVLVYISCSGIIINCVPFNL